MSSGRYTRFSAASGLASRSMLISCIALPSAMAGALLSGGAESSGSSIRPTVPATWYEYSSSSSIVATVLVAPPGAASAIMPRIMSRKGASDMSRLRPRQRMSSASISSAGRPASRSSNRPSHSDKA